MANEIIRIVYRHNHECERKDELLSIRPECRDGVYLDRTPVCIEAGRALEEVDRITV